MFYKLLRPCSLAKVAKGLRLGCAIAAFGFAAPMASAQTFLTEAELLLLIPGASVYSKSDRGTPWAQNYSEPELDATLKGSIRGIYGKRRYYAKWYVKDDKWCENWGNGQACWNVEQVGEKALRLYNDNGRARPNLWYLK